MREEHRETRKMKVRRGRKRAPDFCNDTENPLGRIQINHLYSLHLEAWAVHIQVGFTQLDLFKRQTSRSSSV